MSAINSKGCSICACTVPLACIKVLPVPLPVANSPTMGPVGRVLKYGAMGPDAPYHTYAAHEEFGGSVTRSVNGTVVPKELVYE
jgi:hypothetical protein